MTGFARHRGRINESLGWTLVLKTVNHRFLDLHMRMPAGSEALEMQLRRQAQIGNPPWASRSNPHPGARLAAAGGDGSRPRRQLHRRLPRCGYGASAARDAQPADHPATAGVFRTNVQGGNGNGSADVRTAEMELVEASVLAALPEAVAALQTMRAQEGAALAADLAAIVDRIIVFVDRVTELHGPMQAAHFERTSARIATLLGGLADRERLLQEAAVLADRSEWSEELARLRAHVEHFRQMLSAGGELGKKLDFLLQEMNREANTMLSKTAGIAGAGTQVTEIGLGLKSEIEKAREQVQNLE